MIAVYCHGLGFRILQSQLCVLQVYDIAIRRRQASSDDMPTQGHTLPMCLVCLVAHGLPGDVHNVLNTCIQN